MGCSGTCRVREILEVHLLRACVARGLDPRSPGALESTKHELWGDVSQNMLWMSNPALGTTAPSTNRSTVLYDYRSDRRVLPEELLRAMGWLCVSAAGATAPDCSGISTRSAQDLAGECQALQSLSVATEALLRTVDIGVWAPRRQA